MPEDWDYEWIAASLEPITASYVDAMERAVITKDYRNLPTIRNVPPPKIWRERRARAIAALQST